MASVMKSETKQQPVQTIQADALPERYVRFKCPDRPTAKALAKAFAQEDLLALTFELA